MTAEARPIVWCGSCGAVRDEDPKSPLDRSLPCPACGSKVRLVEKGFGGSIAPQGSTTLQPQQHHQGSVTPRSLVRARNRRPRVGGWVVEVLVGSELFRKADRWVRKLRRVDRERGEYEETVIDPETGRVIHHVRKALRDHRKPKPS
jgi:hypothetical protein